MADVHRPRGQNGHLAATPPVELERLDSDVTIRLRVKQKHSGNYAMYRECNAENRFCAEPTGKFQTAAYVDLTITSVRDYANASRTTNIDKARRLTRAIDHYARQCGAMENDRNTLF